MKTVDLHTVYYKEHVIIKGLSTGCLYIECQIEFADECANNILYFKDCYIINCEIVNAPYYFMHCLTGNCFVTYCKITTQSSDLVAKVP